MSHRLLQAEKSVSDRQELFRRLLAYGFAEGLSTTITGIKVTQGCFCQRGGASPIPQRSGIARRKHSWRQVAHRTCGWCDGFSALIQEGGQDEKMSELWCRSRRPGEVLRLLRNAFYPGRGRTGTGDRGTTSGYTGTGGGDGTATAGSTAARC